MSTNPGSLSLVSSENGYVCNGPRVSKPWTPRTSTSMSDEVGRVCWSFFFSFLVKFSSKEKKFDG